MFEFLKKIFLSEKVTIQKIMYEQQIHDLQQENIELKCKNNDLLNKEKIVEECIFDFNCDLYTPFSIERIDNRTSIGYIFNGEIREWYFNCSIKEHNKLCKQFLERIG